MVLKVFGFLILFFSLFFGYWIQGGDLELFLQPVEIGIIIGLGIGSFILSNPTQIPLEVVRRAGGVFKSHFFGKETYKEAIMLTAALSSVRQRAGERELEKILDDRSHPFFNLYPELKKNERVLDFTRSSMLTAMILSANSRSAPSDAINDAISSEVELFNTFQTQVANALHDLSESMPAYGIVAAITGVILAMSQLGESVDVVGYAISAALMGTLMGIFIGYGLVKPMASSFEHYAFEQRVLMDLIKKSILMGMNNLPSNSIVEALANSVPQHARIDSFEVADMIRVMQGSQRG